MRQCLDRRNQFDSECGGEGIQFFQFLLCIASAAVPEIRISVRFVHVLQIQLNRIVSHAAQNAKQTSDVLCLRHRIPGAIEHYAEPAVRRSFPAAPAIRPVSVLLEKHRGSSDHRGFFQADMPFFSGPLELYSGTSRFRKHRTAGFRRLQQPEQRLLEFSQIHPHSDSPLRKYGCALFRFETGRPLFSGPSAAHPAVLPLF